MRILVDQNIPASAVSTLLSLGHVIEHVRDVLRPDSPDQLIAYLAIREDFVILTHDNDFKNINALTPRGHKKRMKLAARIILGPTGPKAALRIAGVHDLILAMHAWASAGSRQFRVDITEVTVSRRHHGGLSSDRRPSCAYFPRYDVNCDPQTVRKAPVGRNSVTRVIRTEWSPNPLTGQ